MNKILSCLVLASAGLALAQATNSDQPKNNQTGQITVRGCVSREAGDYVLMKDDPGNMYELQAAHGVKLSSYLGQRVEVTGRKSPTLATSSDEATKGTARVRPVPRPSR
ncbi:MAG: hypothetical protein WBX03_11285 [Terriglobales bacterium]|jgi:hypothetical protein